ncbi:hypothetical protein ACFL1H_04330, partial [Nanoarchaeota archaeon]
MDIIIIILLIAWFIVISSIYSVLRKNHPSEYEQMGKPSIWKFGLTHLAILFGTKKLPEDKTLGGLLITYRIIAVLILVLLVVM